MALVTVRGKVRVRLGFRLGLGLGLGLVRVRGDRVARRLVEDLLLRQLAAPHADAVPELLRLGGVPLAVRAFFQSCLAPLSHTCIVCSAPGMSASGGPISTRILDFLLSLSSYSRNHCDARSSPKVMPRSVKASPSVRPGGAAACVATGSQKCVLTPRMTKRGRP